MNDIDIISWIPENLRPATLTATTTLLGGFVGACVAQFFSHRLTLKRERKNSERVVYNELFAPILLEIYMYYDYQTAFRKDHFKGEVIQIWEKENQLDKINDHIGNNLKFASPKIIRAYNAVLRYEAMEDIAGIGKDQEQLALIEELLNELLRISPFDNESKKELSKYRTYYFLFRMLTSYFHSIEDAKTILTNDFYFQNSKLSSNRIYNRLLSNTNLRYKKRYVQTLFRYKNEEDYFIKVLAQKKDRKPLQTLMKRVQEEK
ncbi:hypothetical protein F0M21_13680 [Bacillus velezensis]|uniref:Uncharacterized protein n=1 Tax=Bacillus velezensis (strain DSM 23117 / BGSC 10A6 / LMG 26770 / FZB42) TaxID=326423 RepID=A7Z7P6_BACVZ|nr:MULTISPECIES: hypothetical protein [Bacillus]MBL3611846.1 hypothetical protein [Bacillus sp. RHFS18]ABS75022.1 hypothetical protein RBAM_026640 [Bacillus velezensis FZB42]KAF6548067.1 hypothetical protein G9F51_09880 [Bacillus sp. EKM207B]KAF6549139.1 hypothetical protein G9F50_08555 [Bacillus sp. EKM206B]KAF6556133.1 hypothetical protein G9F47_09435 [Bacillus sp. EKM203B]